MVRTRITKRVLHHAGGILIEFVNEHGYLHKDRGPARIYIFSSGRQVYHYYRNGNLYSPIKKGRDLPTTVAIGIDNTKIFLWEDNDSNTERTIGQLPYKVIKYSSTHYEIFYRGIKYVITPTKTQVIYMHEDRITTVAYFKDIDGVYRLRVNLNHVSICPAEEAHAAFIKFPLPYRANDLPGLHFVHFITLVANHFNINF